MRLQLTFTVLPVLARSPRALLFGLAGAIATLVLLTVPTAIIPNPFFIRMTPIRPLDYVFLGISVLLAALLAASYALPGPERGGGRGMLGGLLAGLAIGCPICNKIVVALIGISGALTYFEPVQPLLGIGGVALLAFAVVVRLAGATECRLARVAGPADSGGASSGATLASGQ